MKIILICTISEYHTAVVVFSLNTICGRFTRLIGVIQKAVFERFHAICQTRGTVFLWDIVSFINIHLACLFPCNKQNMANQIR